uniref:WD_REPEATS_REGION domain-containing protein n=1 Tax=Heterorhabditis bacteriophora TaxID=37862 RepID=A0A1I7WPA5_HETBA
MKVAVTILTVFSLSRFFMLFLLGLVLYTIMYEFLGFLFISLFLLDINLEGRYSVEESRGVGDAKFAPNSLVLFVNNGSQLVSADSAGIIKIWTLATGESDNSIDEQVCTVGQNIGYK